MIKVYVSVAIAPHSDKRGRYYAAQNDSELLEVLKLARYGLRMIEIKGFTRAPLSPTHQQLGLQTVFCGGAWGMRGRRGVYYCQGRHVDEVLTVRNALER